MHCQPFSKLQALTSSALTGSLFTVTHADRHPSPALDHLLLQASAMHVVTNGISEHKKLCLPEVIGGEVEAAIGLLVKIGDLNIPELVGGLCACGDGEQQVAASACTCHQRHLIWADLGVSLQSIQTGQGSLTVLLCMHEQL